MDEQLADIKYMSERIDQLQAYITKLTNEIQRWNREGLSDAEVGSLVRHSPLLKKPIDI